MIQFFLFLKEFALVYEAILVQDLVDGNFNLIPLLFFFLLIFLIRKLRAGTRVQCLSSLFLRLLRLLLSLILGSVTLVASCASRRFRIHLDGLI